MNTSKRSGSTAEDRSWVRGKLRSIPLAPDALPYTETFAVLLQEINQGRLVPLSECEFWTLVLNVRKQGFQRNVDAVATPSPTLTIERQNVLRQLLPKSRGAVDRLPYTATFDAICDGYRRSSNDALSNCDIWRAALKIAKAAIRTDARGFYEKALLHLKRSINEFNLVESMCRTDTVILHLHLATEMLLKASLIQRGIKIRESSDDYNIGYGKCVDWAAMHPKAKFLSQTDAKLLRHLDTLRDYGYHDILELDEAEHYLIAKGTVEVFDRILVSVFGATLADVLQARVLPISTVPLTDISMLLDRKRSQVVSLLRAKDKRRAFNAARTLAALNQAIESDKTPRPTDADVGNTIKLLDKQEDLLTAFPFIAAIQLSTPIDAPSISLSLRGKAGVGVFGKEVDSSVPVAAYRVLDPKTEFPLRHREMCGKIGLSPRVVTALIRELRLKDKPDCCYIHGPSGVGGTPGYSSKALILCREFVQSHSAEQLKDLCSKHISRKTH